MLSLDATAYGMVVNKSKTELMFIKSRNMVYPSQIEVEGEIIKAQTSMKILGIYFDNDLGWKTHCQTLVKHWAKSSETPREARRVPKNHYSPVFRQTLLCYACVVSDGHLKHQEQDRCVTLQGSQGRYQGLDEDLSARNARPSGETKAKNPCGLFSGLNFDQLLQSR